MDITDKMPLWYSACNGVAIYSGIGYWCDGGALSPYTERKMCWENRGKVLQYVERLRQDGMQKVSVKDISNKLGILEEFVEFVLMDEFGDLED